MITDARNGGWKEGPGGEPSAILIRTPNWLGDLLVGTAFVQALMDRFPEASVDLIVRQGFETLPLPRRGSILPFDRHAISAGKFGVSLRERKYSHFFVLPPSFSAAWMAFRSAIPCRVGYKGQGRGWLLRPSLAHRQTPRSVHLANEYLDLLHPWLRGEPPSYPAGLALPSGWSAAHHPLRSSAGDSPGSPYIVLAPGAEYGPAKQWPARHYRETARAMHQAGWRIVAAGLEKERPMAEEILSGIPDGINLCGTTDLPSLTALLAGAELLISNDSGAMHLGAALGIPQIAVFGSTNRVWTAPLNPRAEIVSREEPCSPCYARECPLGHTRCLEELLPEIVVERALALLKDAGPSS